MKNKVFISSFVVSLMLLVSFSVVGSAEAVVRTKGYTKSNGTYVMPHYQTSPNRTKLDNFSTKGNYNPYTGKAGTVNPYKAPKITTKRK